MRNVALILIILTCIPMLAKADWNSFNENLKARIQQEAEKQKQKKADRQVASAPAAMAPSLVCDAALSSLNVCYAFTGAGNTDSKSKKGNEFACKMMRGKLMESSLCPTERLIGKCTVLAGQPKEYSLFYYTGRHTKSSAQADCRNPKSSIHVQGAGVWSE